MSADAFLDDLALHFSYSLRCPDPGCPELLDFDRRRPNILRCAMHGPMLLVDEIARAFASPRPPLGSDDLGVGSARPGDGRRFTADSPRPGLLDRLLTWLGGFLDPGAHEVGF